MNTKIIMDEQSMRRSLTRIAHEIIEKNKGVEDIVFVGIKTRGSFLAKRLSQIIEAFEGTQVAYYEVDISYYRDDHKRSSQTPSIHIPVKDKKVILVDDVLFKGRTVRAAMDAILNAQRAKEIQLAILIDRGHRELPIRADYIGKNIPSSLQEIVKVHVKELDGIDQVTIKK